MRKASLLPLLFHHESQAKIKQEAYPNELLFEKRPYRGYQETGKLHVEVSKPFRKTLRPHIPLSTAQLVNMHRPHGQLHERNRPDVLFLYTILGATCTQLPMCAGCHGRSHYLLSFQQVNRAQLQSLTLILSKNASSVHTETKKYSCKSPFSN